MLRHFAFLQSVFLWATVSLAAQTPQPTVEELNQALQELQDQFVQLQSEHASRLAQLEQRILQLSAAAPQPISVAARPPQDTGSTGGQRTLQALNPEISVIGNFIAAAGQDQVNPLPTFSLQESEVALQAFVDPYARADFFLAIGEDSIEVEEGYVTFPALPGRIGLRAGRMRAAFGRVNRFHNHSLPWVDRPLIAFNLLGGSLSEADVGVKDSGVSISRSLPSPGGISLEATGEVYRGDSGTLFQSSRRRDISVLGHLTAYRDLTEATNVEVGGSYTRGHNDLGSTFTTQLYGLDATLRWQPTRPAVYRSFSARTELVWSRRQEVSGSQRAFGFFASAEYQLARRWFLGGRFDWSERARSATLHDSAGSLVLTFWPSEFNQIRGQFRHMRYAEGQTANEVFFQFVFAIGAHDAHSF